MPTVKRDLFTSCKKVAEKIAPFLRRTPAVKGRITSSAFASIGIRRVSSVRLYRRGPLICFESRRARRSLSLSFSHTFSLSSFFLPTHPRYRTRIVRWKKPTARKYRRQTDKTKLDASALRFMNGLFPECTRCARAIARVHVPSSADLSTNSGRMLNSDGHWLFFLFRHFYKLHLSLRYDNCDDAEPSN